MIEKYIELADRMKRGHGDDEVLEGIDYALRWLDEHPDQVPGRTVTESEVRAAEGKLAAACSTEQAEDFLLALGVTVVPDPEPTNAEKLADDVTEGLHSIRAYMNPCPGKPYNASKSESEQLAEFLDSKGWTKAPGGGE